MSKQQPFKKNQQVTINLENTPDLECWEIKSAQSPMLFLKDDNERCHSKEFVKTFSFKKISAIVSPTGREQVVVIEYVKCMTCGAIKVLNG